MKKTYRFDVIKHNFLKVLILSGLIPLKLSNFGMANFQLRYNHYTYLKKKTLKIQEDYHYLDSDDSISNDIWICWFQGIENAPDIVKKCINSIYRYHPEKKIHLITNENINDYLELPDFILKKRKKGIISDAHFSDIIRTELLIKYGGMWVDATTYLTNRVPDLYFKKKIFMFKDTNPDDVCITYNNWFIISQKNNKMLLELRDLLYWYWKKYNYCKDYFLWHIFLTIICEFDPALSEDIYTVTDYMPHMLQSCFNQEFSNEYWNYLKNVSPVNKLTYKYDKIIDNSYLDYLLKNKI